MNACVSTARLRRYDCIILSVAHHNQKPQAHNKMLLPQHRDFINFIGGKWSCWYRFLYTIMFITRGAHTQNIIRCYWSHFCILFKLKQTQNEVCALPSMLLSSSLLFYIMLWLFGLTEIPVFRPFLAHKFIHSHFLSPAHNIRTNTIHTISNTFRSDNNRIHISMNRTPLNLDCS